MSYISYLLPNRLSNNIKDARTPLAPFNINHVKGRVLWLSADKYVFADNGVTLATDGQQVRLWNDQSIYGDSAFNPSVPNQPTFYANAINGLPMVSFVKESSQKLVVNNPSNFNIGTPTVILVARWQSGGAFLGKGDGTLGDGRHRKFAITPYTSSIFSWWAGTDGQGNCSALATTTNWNIYAIRAKRNNLTIMNVNGVDTYQTSLVDNTSFNTVNLVLGCAFSAGAEFSTSDIAEVMVFNRILTDEETRGAISYLSTKYGIAISG